MTVDEITEAVGDIAASIVDTAAGAAAGAVETVASPARSVGRLERKGAPVRKQAQREAVGAVQDLRESTHEAARAMLPERVALFGLSLVKARARRVDLVGEIAYRGLDLVHGSLKEVASAITRLERASEPPARPQRTVRRAAGTTARQTRTAARRTGRTAARRTSRTRRSARRSAASA
jgi:hypothetical protein